MPLDPNIIMSGPRGGGVDVNALYQQQMQGMENINQMERQRKADALAMEDRAAAQAKEQQAAIAQMMLPSVAAAFSDPSDAGLAAAASLMPPEAAETFAPFMDRLRSVPDPKLRQALLRAEMMKDDEGRLIMAQLEPTANMRLQADTAAQRAALDARRLQLEEQQFAQGEQMTPYQKAQIELERQKIEAAKSKETAEETKKRLADEKRAKDLSLAINEVEGAMTPGGLIDTATGGYLGNLFDAAAATFSLGTEGAEAIARLAPIADLALKMVPRFEGPQSNFDVQSYKDAAGNLADPTVPPSVKRAAAKEIVRLFKKYRDQFEYAPEGAGAGAGEAQTTEGPPQISSDDEYDALPSGAEFLDPDGVLRRKP